MLETIINLIPLTHEQHRQLKEEKANLAVGEVNNLSITDCNGRAWQCCVTRSGYEFKDQNLTITVF